MTNNKDLMVILCLQNFPSVSADVSYTGIKDFIGFREQKLLALNVSNTAIYELHSLENPELQNLDISHTGVSNVARLVGRPIKRLNISHTPIDGIAHILKLPLLENLTIHKGQFTKSDLYHLPKNVKLTVVD